MSGDESELNLAMERYAEGDNHAFPILYGGLTPRLRPFLLRLTKQPTVADDLLQETFIRLHRARGQFAEGASVVPWAYAIARNVWLDHVRSRQRAPFTPLEASGSSPFEPPTGPEADSELALIARQTAGEVHDVLATIPTAQREAFILLKYEGMSVRQAAEVLGSTPSAIKLRAFRAYEALRQAFGVERAKDRLEVPSAQEVGEDAD